MDLFTIASYAIAAAIVVPFVMSIVFIAWKHHTEYVYTNAALAWRERALKAEKELSELKKVNA